MYQVEWLCDKCNETHFGNCPKTTGTLATSTSYTQPSTPLSEVHKQIVKEKNPDNFIDLLCANHFFAGHFGNIIPVNEARIAFEKWLTRHDQAQRQSDLKKLSFHLGVDVKTLQGYLESKVSK